MLTADFEAVAFVSDGAILKDMLTQDAATELQSPGMPQT